MPQIAVQLQNEVGDPVLAVDDRGVIVDLLPHAQDRSYICWRFIREYEDTYFSAPQMPDFIDELDRLRPHASVDQQPVLDEIRAAAERCERENLYMRLIGD